MSETRPGWRRGHQAAWREIGAAWCQPGGGGWRRRRQPRRRRRKHSGALGSSFRNGALSASQRNYLVSSWYPAMAWPRNNRSAHRRQRNGSKLKSGDINERHQLASSGESEIMKLAAWRKIGVSINDVAGDGKSGLAKIERHRRGGRKSSMKKTEAKINES
jgi:hypothetical protein